MEKRSKHNDYATQSKEIIERRSRMNETMRNRKKIIENKLDDSVSSNQLKPHSEKEDDENCVIEPEENLPRRGIKKGQVLKLNVNVQEDGFFEESKLELAEKPMITFNHVCTVTESEQMSFEAIKNSGSRSPSPLLEVPSIKIKNKQAVRPPL